ncbi:hypothetical protein WN51_07945 [Melipona quadrifasciata]|uniref:Uncharacterized protein n=1 Tax=Melipona quadrifasciata TaxID=166423 RepID=A0A0N0BBS5_9HYME|nr:hypothetical protein WN51_07945 [Melipona quadrifasciata]
MSRKVKKIVPRNVSCVQDSTLLKGLISSTFARTAKLGTELCRDESFAEGGMKHRLPLGITDRPHLLRQRFCLQVYNGGNPENRASLGATLMQRKLADLGHTTGLWVSPQIHKKRNLDRKLSRYTHGLCDCEMEYMYRVYLCRSRLYILSIRKGRSRYSGQTFQLAGPTATGPQKRIEFLMRWIRGPQARRNRDTVAHRCSGYRCLCGGTNFCPSVCPVDEVGVNRWWLVGSGVSTGIARQSGMVDMTETTPDFLQTLYSVLGYPKPGIPQVWPPPLRVGINPRIEWVLILTAVKIMQVLRTKVLQYCLVLIGLTLEPPVRLNHFQRNREPLYYNVGAYKFLFVRFAKDYLNLQRVKRNITSECEN